MLFQYRTTSYIHASAWYAHSTAVARFRSPDTEIPSSGRGEPPTRTSCPGGEDMGVVEPGRDLDLGEEAFGSEHGAQLGAPQWSPDVAATRGPG